MEIILTEVVIESLCDCAWHNLNGGGFCRSPIHFMVSSCHLISCSFMSSIVLSMKIDPSLVWRGIFFYQNYFRLINLIKGVNIIYCVIHQHYLSILHSTVIVNIGLTSSITIINNYENNKCYWMSQLIDTESVTMGEFTDWRVLIDYYLSRQCQGESRINHWQISSSEGIRTYDVSLF